MPIVPQVPKAIYRGLLAAQERLEANRQSALKRCDIHWPLCSRFHRVTSTPSLLSQQKESKRRRDWSRQGKALLWTGEKAGRRDIALSLTKRIRVGGTDRLTHGPDPHL